MPWEELPRELRAEAERVLPGFRARTARVTKRGDEARAEGDYLGEPFRIEGEFRGGRMVEFEADGPGSARTSGLAPGDRLPEAARREIDRVLGASAAGFERRVLLGGGSGSGARFEVKGTADGWKWEIAVGADGRLLEVERELRRGR